MFLKIYHFYSFYTYFKFRSDEINLLKITYRVLKHLLKKSYHIILMFIVKYVKVHMNYSCISFLIYYNIVIVNIQQLENFYTSS